MTRFYISRDGTATAIDTKTQLATMSSQTAPGALNVPAGFFNLAGIIAAAVVNFAAAKQGCIFVRLEGPGLPEGPETITIGSGGCQVATGQADAVEAHFIPLNVPVTPGNEILIYMELTGVDVGAGFAGVTLVFEDELGVEV